MTGDGVAIGVLCLETSFTKIPGHIRNPATFDFPVLYQVVPGATPERVVSRADPALLGPFMQAARALEERGAAAITTGCGFLVLFQRELAAAVSVPLFTSSLIQLPMVHRMLRPGQRVGLLLARKEALTRQHLAAVDADAVPVCTAGMASRPEFAEVILGGLRDELNVARLRQEVLAEARQLARDHPDMGALIIECTDLVPFADAIQDALGVPVFDIMTLTRMVHESVSRRGWRQARDRA
jgi:aspartate/glutamate racemase